MRILANAAPIVVPEGWALLDGTVAYGNISAAFDSTGADLILAQVTEGSIFSYSDTFSDNKANQWRLITNSDQTGNTFGACQPSSTGPGHVVSFSRSSGSIIVVAFRGAPREPITWTWAVNTWWNNYNAVITPPAANCLFVCGTSSGGSVSSMGVPFLELFAAYNRATLWWGIHQGAAGLQAPFARGDWADEAIIAVPPYT